MCTVNVKWWCNSTSNAKQKAGPLMCAGFHNQSPRLTMVQFTFYDETRFLSLQDPCFSIWQKLRLSCNRYIYMYIDQNFFLQKLNFWPSYLDMQASLWSHYLHVVFEWRISIWSQHNNHFLMLRVCNELKKNSFSIKKTHSKRFI